MLQSSGGSCSQGLRHCQGSRALHMSASPAQVPLSGGLLIGNIGCALCPTLGLSSPSYHGLWVHKEAEAPLSETFLPSAPRPSGPCPVPFPGEMENWVGEGSASSCLLLVLLQAGIKAHCPTITSIHSSSIYRVTEGHFSAPRVKSILYTVQRPSSRIVWTVPESPARAAPLRAAALEHTNQPFSTGSPL